MSAPNSTITIPQVRLSRRIALFAGIVAIWLLFDIVTKRLVEGASVTQGSVVAGPFLGLFDVTLVHNTGAAWGIFSGSTFALAMFSIAICIIVTICAFTLFKNSSVWTHIGLALVLAGGIGNIIDRLIFGYVVDFIEATFIDFPVFNIADVGVTCGFAIFIIAIVVELKREKASEAALPKEGGKLA